MNTIKTFFKKYWHIVYALYFPIYLYFFVTLENTTFDSITIMHCAIDDLIPFCRFFIIPYLLWFLYMMVAIVFFFFYSQKEFIRYATFLIIGMSLSLIAYALWPSGLMLRPDEVNSNDIFARLVNMLYTTDTPTNVCPSIHCLNSLATHFAVCKSEYFKNKPVFRAVSAVLMLSICLSTMFLKQHSFIDVICAIFMGILLYIVIYSRYRFKLSSKNHRQAVFSSTFH